MSSSLSDISFARLSYATSITHICTTYLCRRGAIEYRLNVYSLWWIDSVLQFVV